MKEELDWQKDIEINPERLDVEWCRQASLFGRYCEALAEKKREHDEAKERLSIVDAEVSMDIRKTPEKYGLDKLTEATVQAALVMDEKHQDESSNLIKLKYEVDVLTAAVRALDQKKDALENLVRLHGQNYFAGPEVPHELKKDWVELAEKSFVQEKVKRKLNKKGG